MPIVFYFDEAGEYMPQQARYATLAMQVILYAVTSIYTLIIAAKEEGQAGICTPARSC